MLLFWLLVNILYTNNDGTPIKPKTLHLKLSSKPPHTKASRQNHKPPPSMADGPKTSPHTESLVNTTQPTPSAKPDNRVSTEQILATAKALTETLATKEMGDETKQPGTTLGAILDKAWNPKREPPGVSELADGTIRVVTEFGLIYCIRPDSNPGIIDPEEILPKSMHCN